MSNLTLRERLHYAAAGRDKAADIEQIRAFHDARVTELLAANTELLAANTELIERERSAKRGMEQAQKDYVKLVQELAALKRAMRAHGLNDALPAETAGRVGRPGGHVYKDDTGGFDVVTKQPPFLHTRPGEG